MYRHHPISDVLFYEMAKASDAPIPVSIHPAKGQYRALRDYLDTAGIGQQPFRVNGLPVRDWIAASMRRDQIETLAKQPYVAEILTDRWEFFD